MNIVIVGATGNVGRKMLEVLEQKKLPIDELYLVASSRSAGKKLSFNGKDYEVYNLETFDFSKAQITFFAAGSKISEEYALKAAKYSTVIDNASFFRMDPDVPLIVPQVNPEVAKNLKKNIIANPNCSTAQLVIVLKIPTFNQLPIPFILNPINIMVVRNNPITVPYTKQQS